MKLFLLFGGVFLLGCAGLGGEDTAGGGTTDIFGNDVDDGNDEEDQGSTDADEDGLTLDEEADLGTDPDEADSDGDGTGDGEEVKQSTDPLDDKDFPYEGGWAKGACRNDLDGEGFAEGDVASNFTMVDQFGEDVSLHDFCDRTVYLVFAAFW